MKKLILAAITVTAAASVFAQGTVSFSNRSAGGTTHVYSTAPGVASLQGNGAADSPAGSTVYGVGYTLIGTTGGMTASTTFAQLLAAPGAGAAESSLVPALGITTFRTGAGAGNVALTTATLGNVAPDAAVASLEMVAWDNSSGLYPTWTEASVAWANNLIQAGRSTEFNLSNIGGSVNTPPNLNPGLTSFSIGVVPEPTTAALFGLGAAGLLIFRRRK